MSNTNAPVQATLCFTRGQSTPAPGTVVVIRLEDWLGLGLALPPLPRPPKQRALPVSTPLSSVRQVVMAWLRGEHDNGTYGADTKRAPDGSLRSTTTDAVVAGCRHPCMTKRLAGEVLRDAAWVKRYVGGPKGRRERRYYAPQKWPAS